MELVSYIYLVWRYCFYNSVIDKSLFKPRSEANSLKDKQKGTSDCLCVSKPSARHGMNDCVT
jgi:hypothetical protein